MTKVQKVYTREEKEQAVQLAQTSGKPIGCQLVAHLVGLWTVPFGIVAAGLPLANGTSGYAQQFGQARSRQATAIGSNREETCHLLAADFPRHSRYTGRGVGCVRGGSTLLGGPGAWRKTPDAPFDFTLVRIPDLLTDDEPVAEFKSNASVRQGGEYTGTEHC